MDLGATPSGCVCGQAALTAQRERLVPHALGDVIEIGFGRGENLPYYDAVRTTRITGIEPSASARRKAARVVGKTAIPVELVDARAEDLPAADASVDTVVMTYTLCTVQDPQAALAEIRRVLKPEGRLLFCEHGAAPDASLSRWQRRWEPVWKLFNGGCHLTRPIDQLIEEAGFRIEQIDTGRHRR